MKRFIVIITLTISVLVPGLVLTNAYASPVNPVPDCGAGHATPDKPDVCQDIGGQQGNNGNNNPIINIIKAAIEVLSFIIGAAAIIGIIVSGIRIMTAGGDSQAVASARSGLIYSLIGVAVVALAQVLVALVLDKVQ